MGILENTINEISEKNSTTIPLTQNQTFIGEVENILAFSSLELNIYSDSSSSINGIKLICGQDKELITGIYTTLDTYSSTKNYHRIFPLKGRFMRIEYTNSGTTQSVFKLQAIKTILPPNAFEYIENSYNNSNTDITTSTSTSTSTSFAETQLDAFGRLRISNPITIFENNNIYTKESEYIDEYINGSNAMITFQLSNSAVILSSQDNNDKVIRQSHQYINYQPGKSLLIYASGVLNPQLQNESNVSTYIGYFDDENGIYFTNNNSNTYIGIRSNTSGTIENREVIQSQWNIDTLDGYGDSGIILDISKTQIFYIDIEWLGVGTVRTGFIIDGKYYLTHKFNHANIRENVYMTTPNLPVRYEINASGSSNTQGKLMEICSTAISEGGFEPAGIRNSLIRRDLLNIARNTESALLAIRLKENFKRAYNRITSVNVLVNDIANDRIIYRLRTYKDVSDITQLFSSGSTFTSINTNSIMEGTVNPVFNNINFFDNHIILESFAVSGITDYSDNFQGLFIASNVIGSRDILVLSVDSLDNNTSVYGSINWIEHI